MGAKPPTHPLTIKLTISDSHCHPVGAFFVPSYGTKRERTGRWYQGRYQFEAVPRLQLVPIRGGLHVLVVHWSGIYNGYVCPAYTIYGYFAPPARWISPVG